MQRDAVSPLYAGYGADRDSRKCILPGANGKYFAHPAHHETGAFPVAPAQTGGRCCHSNDALAGVPACDAAGGSPDLYAERRRLYRRVLQRPAKHLRPALAPVLPDPVCVQLFRNPGLRFVCMLYVQCAEAAAVHAGQSGSDGNHRLPDRPFLLR